MHQIKALRVLSVLNKNELQEFDRFVNSPFFNRSKEVIKLFSFIKKYYPQFDESKLRFDKIYSKIYPGKIFNEGTLRNLFTDLGNLSEKFLGYISYENSFDFGLNVLHEANTRYLDKEFNKNYKNIFEHNQTNEDNFYKKNLNQYHLLTELDLFNDRRKIIPKDYTRNIIFEPLFVFFFAEFLFERSSKFSVAFSKSPSDKYDIVELFFDSLDINKIISGMKNNSTHYKDIEFYYSLFVTAQNRNGSFYADFDKTYKLFKGRINGMTKEAQYRMYIWLRNVINLHMKAEDKELMRLLFQIGKEMVAKKVILDETEKMSTAMFVNLIHGAILVKELDWASEFLEDHIDYLDEKAKADFYNYYKAKILSRQKKYIESNEQLLKIGKEDVLFKTDSKVLRMINYFELGYIETAFSQAETFRQFVKRNEGVESVREKCTNFLKYYLILLKKKSGEGIDVSLEQKELFRCIYIRNKDWLLEKFEELR